MDFQFTSRPSANIKPVWVENRDEPHTPQKRPFNDLNPPAPPFPSTPSLPTFGSNPTVPFIFQSPAPQTPYTPAWAPPPQFSPIKAFPQEEIRDVDMAEASPPNLEEASDGLRAVALGGMKRVFKSRQKARERALQLVKKRSDDDGDESDDDGESESDRDAVQSSPRKSRVQKTSHHYTLNMPSPSAPHADTPYILLGYLQFFFNLSLILVFLYLVLQFILTVQRDVEQRISEYSMDIVQEISNCAAQYKANLCGSNPIPAMMRQCGAWETCMNRDPTVVGRARVGAELIAEVVNGFVEPISWKTLVFTLTSLAFLTIFINALLSLYRSRHHPEMSTPPLRHQPSYTLAPPTPFPPQYLPASSWGSVWSGREDEEVQTPSRRRRLDSGEAAKIK